MSKYYQTKRGMGRELNRQRGSALIVALVFLLVMTLIGTTAMQGTTQQEHMAGNYLDRMMAFQAAEGALSMAKDATPPILPNQLTTLAWQQPASWWDTNPVSIAVTGYGDLSSPPQYVIEKLSGSGRSESGGVGIVGRVSEGTFMCRFTARSVGGSNNAVVILEETNDCS